MGFASKLAAAQGGQSGGYPPTGGPPGGYGGYPPQGQQGRPGAYPGQQQYQPYPGPNQQGGPQATPGYPQNQQGQYGQQPGGYPAQGGQYGGALQPASPAQEATYRRILQQVIQERNLGTFFPPNKLEEIVKSIGNKVDQICAAWRLPREIGIDLIKLALFDIILYIDDSGSMEYEENGERKKDLKVILSKVAYAAALFDNDGIQVRFMNHERQGNNIRTEQEAAALVDAEKCRGITPMGTALKNRILDPLVIGPARAGVLRKPVLIITITDGQPTGELDGNTIFGSIRYAASALDALPNYRSGAVAFQFAQVGNDLEAREFLAKLDKDPTVGKLVDCISSELSARREIQAYLHYVDFEVEQDEMSKLQTPVDLTPELWLVKLLLGSIDSSYDMKDESVNRPPGGQSVFRSKLTELPRVTPAKDSHPIRSKAIHSSLRNTVHHLSNTGNKPSRTANHLNSMVSNTVNSPMAKLLSNMVNLLKDMDKGVNVLLRATDSNLVNIRRSSKGGIHHNREDTMLRNLLATDQLGLGEIAVTISLVLRT
ncbi:MAG: hypothetical protein M1816_004867 [Peltula sp. TS41687]|nr:MAG: hypothetical protein M1816_004867 [Peltula sp. TS41687]